MRETTDENGVDLPSGAVKYSSPELAIGGDSGSLTFERYWISGGWNHNYFMYVQSHTFGLEFLVVLGGRTVKFGMNYPAGSLLPSQSGDGSTLKIGSQTITFTDRDGTSIIFQNTPSSDMVNFQNRRYWFTSSKPIAYATQIKRPSGEIIRLHNEVETASSPLPYGGAITSTRILTKSITSSFGYQLKLEHADGAAWEFESDWGEVTKVTAINNAVDYCDPLATSCGNLSKNWPSVSYTKTTVGSTTTETATDNLGRTTTYTIEDVEYVGKRLKTVRSPASTSVDLTYNYMSNSYGPNDKTVSSVKVGTNTWTYNFGTPFWDEASKTYQRNLSKTSPAAATTTYLIDQDKQRVLRMTDPLGRVSAMGYDAQGRLTSYTHPEGNKVLFTLDTRGNVLQVRQIAKTPGSPADIVTTATFPASCTNAKTCNKPTATTDARGSITNYTWSDTHGGMLTKTLPPPAPNATRPKLTASYAAKRAYFKNAAGSIVASSEQVYLPVAFSNCRTLASCSGSADELRTARNYGPQVAGTANNLGVASITTAAGDNSLSQVSKMTYDHLGNLLTVDGPLAGTVDTTRRRYDDFGQLIGVIGPDPDGAGVGKHAARRFTYNTDGLRTKEEGGTVASQSDAAWSAFSAHTTLEVEYDSLGSPTKQINRSGGAVRAITQFSYDTTRRLECTAVRLNPMSVPSSACTLGSSGSDGPDRISKNFYNIGNQLISVQTALGTPEQRSSRRFGYGPNGQIAWMMDGNGNKTAYLYDGHNRLAQIDYPHKTSTGSVNTSDDEIFAYDANSNVVSITRRDNRRTYFGYDNLNRVILKRNWSSSSGYTDHTYYGYDLDGRQTYARYGSATGQGITNSFDALGRLASSVDTTAGGSRTTSYQYDAASRRQRLTWSDGFFVTYEYRADGSLMRIRENGSTVLATYSYDEKSRRTSIAYANGTSTSWAYDPASRLASIELDFAGTSKDLTKTFHYNAAGQVIRKTRNNDSYSWSGHYNVDRTYSINGLNQIAKSGAQALTHDPNGNLINDGGGNLFVYDAENRMIEGPSGVSLTYDPLGRLHQIDGAQDLRFGYDGLDQIAEYSSSGTLLRRFVHGDGVDDPLLWYEGSGVADKRYFHKDEIGSVIAITNTAGTSIATNTYDEHGIPDISNVGRFQLTGQSWFPGLGLYYYKSRFYSPTLGRFMQTDPIRYVDNMNLYAYVSGDPVNLRDPLGLEDGGPNQWPGSNLNDIVVTGTRMNLDSMALGSISPSIDLSAAITGININLISAEGPQDGGYGGAGASGSWTVEGDEVDENGVPVIVVRALAPLTLVDMPRFQVVFGYPNEAGHSIRHLIDYGFNDSEIQSLKRKIAGHVQISFEGPRRYAIRYKGETYFYGAFEVRPGIINVGSIYR